ncbi:THUMP domain-containing protein 3-like [Argonauta hians]
MASPISSHVDPSMSCNDEEWCLVECTVCTGFEKMAREEAMEVLGVEDVRIGHGHIVIRLPVKNTPKVLTLNGIDNCSVLIHETKEFGFSNNEEECMKQLQNLVEKVDWKLGIKVWFQVYSFPLPISEKPVTYPVDFGNVIPSSTIPLKPKQEKANRNDYGKRRKKRKIETGDEKKTENNGCDVNKKEGNNCDDTKKEETMNCEKDEKSCGDGGGSGGGDGDGGDGEKPLKKPRRAFDETKPTFRATCHRNGENHSFNSMIAAANFGGAVQTYFGWNVDMKNFDIEVILRIVNNSVSVGIALTKESLHRRLITNFGPTTLRATTAYNMLRLCKIQDGEVVCDPMCGSGAIPIQAAVCWPKVWNICGEIHPRAMEKIEDNINAVNKQRKEETLSDLGIDVFKWDATSLPLASHSVDVFITDLPFGKRVGSRKDNWKLYPSVMHEMARVAKLNTGRACLLTQDKKCMFKCMQHFAKYWKKQSYFWVNIGGLAAGVWLFRRTSVEITGTSVSTLWHSPLPENCPQEMPIPDNQIPDNQ